MMPMLMGTAAKMLKPSESKKEVNKKITASKFVSKSGGADKKDSSIVKVGASSIVVKPSAKLSPKISLPPVKETRVPQGKISFDHLNNILDTLVKNTNSLLKISRSEYKSSAKDADAARRSDQLERKVEREERAETKSKISREKKELKISAPKMPGVFEFLKRFAIGTAIMEFLKWISDPNNKNSLLKFIENNFLGLFIGALGAMAFAVLAPIIGPMGMIFTVLKVLGGVAIGVGKIALGLAKRIGSAAKGGGATKRGAPKGGKGGGAKPTSPKVPRGGLRGGGGILGTLLTFIVGPKIQEVFDKYVTSPIEKAGLQKRVENFVNMDKSERGKYLNGLQNRIKELENYIANDPRHKAEQAISFLSGQGETVSESRLRQNRALLEAIQLVLEEEKKKMDASPQPKTPMVSGTRPDIVVGERAGYSATRGRVHAGRDIAADHGTGLTVPSDSEITDKGFEKNYGNYVAFKDAQGVEHFYGHMAEPTPFKVGDKVSVGDIIGRVGSTGRSTGPHLHWEISPRLGEVGFPRRTVIDPIEYGYAAEVPFTGIVKAATMTKEQPQKPAAKSAPAVAQYASYEEPKNGAALIPIPIQTGSKQQATGMGGNTSSVNLPVSPYQVLNTYYNFQVLGFLYKQG